MPVIIITVTNYLLLCLHYIIVSYFVSVVYIMMYYYTGSTAEIAFSVSQVLY